MGKGNQNMACRLENVCKILSSVRSDVKVLLVTLPFIN